MPTKDIAKTASAPSPKQSSPFLLIVLTVVILAVLGLGGYFIAKKVNHIGFKPVTIGQETFWLEVADNDAARIKGLSNREALAKNNGMLFDFKTDGDWRMWMVDMHFNIDIIWLDATGKIVYTKPNATPASYPEVYHPNMPTRYVIELPNNTIKRLGVKTGDIINL